MSIRRRTLTASLVAVATMASAACTSEPTTGVWYPDSTDAQRALWVWRDAWLQLDEATTAGPLAKESAGVNRTVGRGSGTVRGSASSVTSAELAAATAGGWRLVGSRCGAAQVVLQFERGDGTADAQARTTLTFAANGGSDDPSTVWVRTVVVEVPHHAEQPWPTAPTVQFDACAEAPALPSATAVPKGTPQPVPTWPATVSTSEDEAIAGRANQSEFLTSHNLAVAPAPTVGDAPTASYSPPRAFDKPLDKPVPTLVFEAQADGFVLTHTSCGLGRTIAELRRPIDSASTVTVRLVSSPDGTDEILRGSALVGRSDMLGPPTLQEPAEGACWDSPVPDNTIVATGRPWFGPTSVQRSR